jgi:hypothetical protein
VYEFQLGIRLSNPFGIGLVHSEMKSSDGLIITAKALDIKANNPPVIVIDDRYKIGPSFL